MELSSEQIKRRRTFGGVAHKARPSMVVYLSAWNLMGTVDRRGYLRNQRYLNAMLSKTFGKGFRDRQDGPMIIHALRDYLERRDLSQGPLRFKSLRRLKTLPVVGTSLVDAARAVLTKHGVDLEDVVSMQIHKNALSVVVREPAPDPVARLRRVKEKAIRKSSINEAGLAMTPQGLDITLECTRYPVKVYHLAVEEVLTSGFAKTLLEWLRQRHVNTVALDESMREVLPNKLRSVNTAIRRECRAQKTVGVIEFGVVSSVGEEAQECAEYLRGLSLATKDLRSGLRHFRHRHLLTCPHCGAPVVLMLDPDKHSPVGERVDCRQCGSAVRVGHLLAARASAYVQYDWAFGFRARGGSSDRIGAAPLSKTTITTKKKKTKNVVPATTRGRSLRDCHPLNHTPSKPASSETQPYGGAMQRRALKSADGHLRQEKIRRQYAAPGTNPRKDIHPRIQTRTD